MENQFFLYIYLLAETVPEATLFNLLLLGFKSGRARNIFSMFHLRGISTLQPSPTLFHKEMIASAFHETPHGSTASMDQGSMR